MNIFVSEFLCSGAFAGREFSASLLCEGAAMLWSVVDDFLRVPECRVSITLDARLLDVATRRKSENCHVVSVAGADEERRTFDRLATTCDATLVIAPETDGELVRRVRQTRELGAESLNCSVEAIELCGDKLKLARHLDAHHLPTIPTQRADLFRDEPADFLDSGCVLKPRDGAGSWLTVYIPPNDRDGWRRVAQEFASAGALDRALCQPFIAGETLSAGCLCYSDDRIEILPVGRQNVAPPRFQYQGGTIPAQLPDDATTAIVRLIRKTCESIPGLRGYVGFDLLLPDAAPLSPLIVEINPRLTTSYVGYRRLCRDNLAERWLQLEQPGGDEQAAAPLGWKSDAVHFNSAGECCGDH
jgi:tyramine---L-glutamate ligase